MPSRSAGHLVGGAVDDVEGQFRNVVEGATDLGQSCADIEVTLLDLGSEVAFADRDPQVGVAVGSPGS